MNALIDKRFDEEIAFLKQLICIPSTNPPGKCAKAAEEMAQHLEQLGMTVEQLPVAKPFVRQNGLKSVTNLIVRKTFGSRRGPTIALQAHGDTVPPGDGWSVDPYGAKQRGDLIYGLGAASSKSDIATYAFAMLALDEVKQPLNGTVELHVTFDEQTGGTVGPLWLLEQGLTKPDYAITSGFTHIVATAHNGCLHLEVVIRGRQAHAAMPDTGADALRAATSILSALYKERDRLSEVSSAEPGIGSPQLTVGLIAGGISFNVVPDRVVLSIDRRLIPEETGEKVEQQLTELIEAATLKSDGVETECRRIMLAEPMRPIKRVKRLAKVLRENASEVLGNDIPVTGVPLYTDARHYAASGVPTVLYGAGPRKVMESSAHSADEHIAISDLRLATEVVARSLVAALTGRLD